MKKNTIIIIVVAVVAVIFFLVVAIAGIGFILAHRMQQRAGITDMHIDKQGGRIEFKGSDKTGGQVQMEVGKTAKWPEEIPSEVPEFTYGKLNVVSTTNVKDKKTWTLIYESSAAGALEKYKQDLTNKGWSIQNTMQMGEGGSIQAEKDKLQVFIMVELPKGNASLTIAEK